MAEGFAYRDILGKSVHRYGISASYGLDEAGVREAIDLGANYIFWSPAKKFLKTIIKDAVIKDRDRFMLATGPIFGYFAGCVRRSVEKALRASGSDYLDVVQVFWAGRLSALTRSVIDELVKLRQEGKARAIGVSIHDRKRAAKLAAQGPLVVSAPKTTAQMRENMQALARGPLNDEEMARMRALGKAVHG
jgi:diketogulonate reductase-like aldo/keto reductase